MKGFVANNKEEYLHLFNVKLDILLEKQMNPDTGLILHGNKITDFVIFDSLQH